jgi:hypothetical protein
MNKAPDSWGTILIVDFLNDLLDGESVLTDRDRKMAKVLHGTLFSLVEKQVGEELGQPLGDSEELNDRESMTLEDRLQELDEANSRIYRYFGFEGEAKEYVPYVADERPNPWMLVGIDHKILVIFDGVNPERTLTERYNDIDPAGRDFIQLDVDQVFKMDQYYAFYTVENNRDSFVILHECDEYELVGNRVVPSRMTEIGY